MMTSTYRKLFASSAKSLLDGNPTMNLVGEGKRVDAFRSVYDLTHKLYETLFSDDVTLAEIGGRECLPSSDRRRVDFITAR